MANTEILQKRRMTNTKLLQKRIKKSGLKTGYIAEKIGLSRSGLWKKMNNLSYFNQPEMDGLCKILKITTQKERDEIFFA